MAAESLGSHLENVVKRAGELLSSLDRRWALVGGLAVSARTEPRFTRDADLAVAVADDHDAEALILKLQRSGYRTLAVLEQEVTGRLATVRLEPPDGSRHGIILDLLFASSGIEPEIVERATLLEAFPGLELPVARIGELLALKILARDDEKRPQDRVDIVALLSSADPADLEAARDALRLITDRGCARQRDLLADFSSLVGGE